ncbi:hypothetical protein M3Y95_00981000 [Aphelenchoides besseyi]|nr:hypothetical protein M3Y95_00981000 [Aphelenchoides besseyi]
MEANETTTQKLIVGAVKQTTKNASPWIWCWFAPILLFFVGLFVLLCWLESQELQEARKLFPLLEDEATFHAAEVVVIQMENKPEETTIEEPEHQQVQ